MELIQLLSQNLGIQEEQAKGGAGLLFKLAQEKLGDGDFGKLAQVVPEMSELVQLAPESGGLIGALGGLASAMGGQAEGLGNLATLAAGFSKLGLDGGDVGKFIPVILSYVQSQGGEEIKGLLENVLK